MKWARRLRVGTDAAAKWVFDRVGAAVLLVLLLPLIVVLAVAIRLESSGPVFYRCRRVGHRGREFLMLKFRKMRDGAAGSPLTAPDDARFTRIGALLARTKLDEVPQLWNVLKGEMSFVGPRPEDPVFVDLDRDAFARVLVVKPGITGLSQLAFARESEILDPDDRLHHYVERLLPSKAAIDTFYAQRRSLSMDARIFVWTLFAVLLRRDVAVHRDTGRIGVRRRSSVEAAPSVATSGGA